MSSLNIVGDIAVKFGPFLKNCRKHWWWFAISIIACVCMAFAYTKLRTDRFLVQSSILVSEDGSRNKGVLSLAKSFDLGGALGGTSSVYNEQMVMSSNTVFYRTVEQLQLNEMYLWKKNFLKKITLNPQSTPIKISCAPEIPDTLKAGIAFNIKVDKTGSASVKMKVGKKTLFNKSGQHLPLTIHSAWGDYTLSPTPFYKPGKDLNIKALYLGYQTATDLYRKLIVTSLPNRKSDFIALSYATPDPEFGKKIMSDIIENYNAVGIMQQQSISNRTLKFLTHSLDSLSLALADRELQVENYKRELKVADVETAAKLAINRQETYRNALLQAETNMEVMKLVNSFISNPDNNTALIPALTDSKSSLGIAVAEYNEIVLKRMKLESAAKANNISIKLLDDQLDVMRKNIASSLSKSMQADQIRLNELRAQATKANSEIASIPSAEREYISIYRQQQVEEQLYLYLLKQKEETAMNLANVQPRGIVIDAPYAASEPLGLSSKMTLILGFFFGLFVPGTILFIKERIKNTTAELVSK